MIRIERVRKEFGSKRAVLDLQISTAQELPSLGGMIEGYTLLSGSIAQIIQTGDFVTLDDDGDWYDASGNVVGDD